MAKKELKKILNELIAESGGKKINDGSRIVSLDIPVVRGADKIASVDLNDVVIFDGVENIVSKLIEEIRESCFFGQSDVSVTVKVERDISPQFFDAGIYTISFYSLIENLEQLPLRFNDMVNHLRYIFNALQSPEINKGFFFQSGADENTPASLLFPFNREDGADQSGLHYLVERLPGAHFLRIIAEEVDHSRLNFRRINHRVISSIELINYSFNIREEAFIINAALINRCHDHKLSFKDSGLQLSSLIWFLHGLGYNSLDEITINWPRFVIDDFLTGNDAKWVGHFNRLLLILSDSTTKKLFSEGSTIETRYAGTKAYLSLTRKSRNLKIDLQEKLKISELAEYLVKMERLDKTVDKLESLPKNLHVLFIHHFTAETLAVLGAFDKMGVYAVDTLWVKYSGSVPSRYLETILSLPSSVYRFYGLQQLVGTHFRSGFSLSGHYSSIENLTLLKEQFEKGEYDFFEAMQRVGMHLFLNALLKDGNTRIVIAEDGGYLAPLVNRLALEKRTVGEVMGLFGYDEKTISDELKKQEFGQWISPRFCGSVEHTRNGYDALTAVETEFSQLAFPACTLAISNFKVNDESVEVAYSCLNAIENIMAGQGYVLNNRNVLVLGSLGAIGRQTMKIFSHRVGAGNLTGIDVKSDKNIEYAWQHVSNYSELTADTLASIDLIFGVVGRSVLDVTFFEELILNTNRNVIFLASGSTKRFEFIDFIDWTATLLDTPNPVLKGFPLKISTAPVEDPQTSALQGSIILFEIEKNGHTKQVYFYLLSSGMPVNFQYYGVARETMDSVMTEFVSLVNIVSWASEKVLPPKVLALDHSIDINGNLK